MKAAARRMGGGLLIFGLNDVLVCVCYEEF